MRSLNRQGEISVSAKTAVMDESEMKTVERSKDLRKMLSNALLWPFIILAALSGVLVFYVAYIFPLTANAFLAFSIALPPMTAKVLKISEFLQHNALYLLSGTGIVVITLAIFVASFRGKYLASKFVISLPLIGTLIHKTNIEIWCRAFHSLYQKSGKNLGDVCFSAADACNNFYIKQRIKGITHLIQCGLVQALEASNVFTANALSRLQLGVESGTVQEAALQLANEYEQKTVPKLRNLIDMIQVGIALLIMIVMTAITIISSETATVFQPIQNIH